MKRVLMLSLLAVLLLAALAAPAGAAKAGKPAKVYYEATMGLVAGSGGLATTCEPGPIKMLFDPTFSQLSATGLDGTEVAKLFVWSDIDWTRNLKYWLGQSGTGFAECHGGQTPGSTAVWGGNLMIHLDAAGNPDGLLWHFDHYVEAGRRGKVTLLEGFTLNTEEGFSYDPVSKVAEGTFTLYRWEPGLYERQGTQDFRFTLQVVRMG